MARFNTGNSIDSKDPRDLSDNAQNIDQWANSDSASFPDRLGVARRTLRGMDGEFQSFLDGSAYDFLGDYAAGIEVTSRSQVIRDAGEFWRASAGTELPYTTTGAGMPEAGAFVSVGDAVLRQDLAGTDGLDFIGGTGTAAARNVGTGPEDVPDNSALDSRGFAQSVASVEALRAMAIPDSLERIWLEGYYGQGTPGGGALYVDRDDTASVDNGGTVFVDADGSRIKRQKPEYYTPFMFGAVANGASSDRDSLLAMMDSEVSPVLWGSSKDVFVVDSEIKSFYSKGASIVWHGGGAKIIAPESADRFNTMLGIEVHGGAVSIKDLYINANHRAIRGLACRNLNDTIDQSDKTDFFARNVHVEKISTNELIGQSAIGIAVLGSISQAILHGCSASNFIQTLAGWNASRPLIGINVSHSGVERLVDKIVISSCDIKNLVGEDATIDSNINGLDCFDPPEYKFSDLSCEISGCKFTNIWGGDIKLQKNAYGISDCTFVNDTAGPAAPSRAFLRLQRGSGAVRNCTFRMSGWAKNCMSKSARPEDMVSSLTATGCRADNLTNQIAGRLIETFVSSPTKDAPPCDLNVTSCHIRGRFNEFAYLNGEGKSRPSWQFDDCSADSLEIDASRQDYIIDEDTDPWFFYRRFNNETGKSAVCRMTNCRYEGNNLVGYMRTRAGAVFEGHGNIGFSLIDNPRPFGTAASQSYMAPIFMAEGISTRTGVNSDVEQSFISAQTNQTLLILPNETYEFDVFNGASTTPGVFCFLKLDSTRFYMASFIWDGGTTVDMNAGQSYAQRVIISSGEPTNFDEEDRLYVWGGDGKIRLRSTRSTSNRATLVSF